MNVIPSISAGRIGNCNGLHTAPGRSYPTPVQHKPLFYIKHRHLIALGGWPFSKFFFNFFFDRLLCFPLVSQQLCRYPPFLPLNKGISHLRAASSFAQKLHESLWLESETDAPTLLLPSVSHCAVGIPLELRQRFLFSLSRLDLVRRFISFFNVVNKVWKLMETILTNTCISLCSSSNKALIIIPNNDGLPMSKV